MKFANLCVLGLSVVMLSACGSKGGDGNAGAAPTGALKTRTGTYEVPTMDGDQKFTYAIDLPDGYVCKDAGTTLQRWEVTGKKHFPAIRIMPSGIPPTLADAAEQAKKGGIDTTREVIFSEETDASYVVGARETDGEWTQVDAWTKGKGLTPYCKIEMYKVPQSSEQVDWARRVAKTFRNVP